MSLLGNIQFNSEKLRQGYKPIFAIKFDNYANSAHKYYASKTVTLDSNPYLMMCESLPNITRSVEYLGGLSTIGSVNLTIINQAKESDFLRTTGLGYIMGSALIAIVFNDGTTPQWTERLEIFTGKIDDLTEISEDSLGFSLIDSSKLTDQTIGTLIIDSTINDTIGKMQPIVYGDHSFININTVVPSLFSLSYKNNMAKGIRVGATKFIIANHILNQIDTDNIWLYDNTVNRYMQLDPAHVTVNNPDGDGLCSIELTLGASIVIYDWIFPLNSINNPSNNYNWSNPENAGDNNINTYSTFSNAFDSSGGLKTGTLYFYFGDWDVTEYNSIINVDGYYRGYYICTGGDDTDLHWYAYSLDIDLKPIATDTDINNIGSLGTTLADINNNMVIGGQQSMSAKMPSVLAKVYCFYKKIEFDISNSIDFNRFEVFVSCKGREYDTWINDRSTSETDPNTGLNYTVNHPDDDRQGDLIENPVGVIESVLRDILGFGNSNLEVNSFNIAADARDGWKYSFAILEQLKGDAVFKYLSRLAFECQCWLFWNYANRLEIIAYSTSPNFSSSGGATPISDDIFIHQPEKIAIEFTRSAADAYIHFNHNANHQITGDMTFECLFCLIDLDNDQAIFSYGGSDASELEADNCLYQLNYVAGTSDTFAYRHEYSTGTEVTKNIVLDGSLSGNTWYRLCMVRDNSDEKVVHIYIYSTVTGELIASGSSTAYTVDATGGTSGTLKIGAKNNATDFIDGYLKDCRLWNVARTATQLRDNANKILTGNESGLVGYWRFDEGSGATAFDITATADGTLGGDLAWTKGTTIPVNGYYSQHPIVKDSFRITLIGTADLINDLTINYFKNYQSGQTQNTSNTTDAGSITKYGTLTETVESEFIADATTVASFRDLLLTKKKEKYYIATFKSWLNAATKTEGDVINIRHPILDSGIMSNANMVAAKWQIIKISHNLNNGEVEITAVILAIP